MADTCHHPPIMLRALIAPVLVLLFCARLVAADVAALPFVSPVFAEHMVLQRGKPNRIWGWTAPGAEVRIEIAGQSAKATAAADGRWQAEFTPPPAGGPYTLKIDGPQHVELLPRGATVDVDGADQAAHDGLDEVGGDEPGHGGDATSRRSRRARSTRRRARAQCGPPTRG